MEQKNSATQQKKGFGMAAVYLTSVSSVLGAILFLRFGFATGTLGFWGAIFIVLLGHLITIPTALAISELATNTRVEGGGEYFIISRSFGLKIGSTIGITLFLSQTISIAFYVIAFAESFQFLFDWCRESYHFELPKQVISVPTLLLLAFVILKQGTGSGMKLLYIVNLILFVSLLLFFLGNPIDVGEEATLVGGENFGFFNEKQFFFIFAICFPAFTGMTAGVGLSGDLRNPGRAIPVGTMLGTLTGLVVYIFVIWKLSVSAPQAELVADQMIMSRIALFGAIVIPVGLAACTSSSALGAMMVAPRTLQAIAGDKTFPFRRLNILLARGRGESREPRNASILTFAIALIFIILGDVNTVAEIISMFFLITYGTLCLSSFLNHFGSPPSYRPRFKSRWYLSLAGFLLSVWVMFMINPLYTFLSYIVIILIYLFVEHYNKDRKGLVNIFKGALFQLNRQLQVYMQKHQSNMDNEEWRPAAICVSSHSFEREKVLELMKWISYQHGFGTYFHLINGYYSRQTHKESKVVLEQLINNTRDRRSTLYIDTMISPSYTSAIAQVIQTPSISGMENNLVIFEYDKQKPEELSPILDNVNLVRAGNFDVGIFAVSQYFTHPANGIHVWIREYDANNTNFMILLGYIIMSHPDWKKSHLKIFLASIKESFADVKEDLEERIATGRLPITMANIEFVMIDEHQSFSDVVETHSSQAGLTIIGFHEEMIKHEPIKFFTDFDAMGDILFVNAASVKEIL
ncbi:amino acid permease [Bacteroides sp. OttesenSCG-928-D19]|nr:amino acid permease [Bacteroides sp. OttesenSCG-928-D19]